MRVLPCGEKIPMYISALSKRLSRRIKQESKFLVKNTVEIPYGVGLRRYPPTRRKDGGSVTREGFWSIKTRP